MFYQGEDYGKEKCKTERTKLQGELQYRLAITNGVITGHFVDLLAQRGQDRGKQSVALFANDATTYLLSIIILATLVSKLDFLENISAIIRNSEAYFKYKESR